MLNVKIKRVQTEIPQKLYEEFKRISEREGKTIKEALAEAIEEWRARRRKFDKSDPLFDFSFTVSAGGDASRVDEITYSEEAVK